MLVWSSVAQWFLQSMARSRLARFVQGTLIRLRREYRRMDSD